MHALSVSAASVVTVSTSSVVRVSEGQEPGVEEQGPVPDVGGLGQGTSLSNWILGEEHGLMRIMLSRDMGTGK